MPGTRRAPPTVQTLPMSDLHADDEALSAHLDRQGHEQDPRLRDHLESCTACTARLTELRRVRAALAAPVTRPAAWQREAAISHALDATGDRGGARRKLGTWAGGIAAAILLVLGAAFGISVLSNGGHDTASRASKAATQTREAAGAATPPTTIAVAELGDLGALPDTAALRAVVQPTVAQLAARGPKAAVTVPESAATAGKFRSGDSAPEAERRCVDAARALDPANVSPAAAGTATWRGARAEVLVYSVSGRPGAARVYVLAQADCRVLEFQSYAP
jgi:UPF0716 family protein affecting phage T7 exclusion